MVQFTVSADGKTATSRSTTSGSIRAWPLTGVSR
jgi:hypothetical protein